MCRNQNKVACVAALGRYIVYSCIRKTLQSTPIGEWLRDLISRAIDTSLGRVCKFVRQNMHCAFHLFSLFLGTICVSIKRTTPDGC